MEQKTERKQYRLILIPVIAAMMLLGMCMTAWAESCNVWVGTVEVTTERLSGDGWKYDPQSQVLTLNGYHNDTGVHLWGNSSEYSAAIYSGHELTIEFTDTNTLTNAGGAE